jgi:uncharacterized protein YecE (DUF72 family)
MGCRAARRMIMHCRGALGQDRSVYAYFNNDWNCRAPENARALMEMTQPELVHA